MVALLPESANQMCNFARKESIVRSPHSNTKPEPGVEMPKLKVAVVVRK
jgi:hypothetical protein